MVVVMKRLQTLKVINHVMAAIVFLFTAIFLSITTSTALQLTSALEAGPTIFAVFALGIGLLLSSGIFLCVLGTRIGEGQWRMAQTAMAGLVMFTFPVGTIYAIYAVWCCWFCPEARGAFVTEPDLL